MTVSGGGPQQLIAQTVAVLITIALSGLGTLVIGRAIHKTIGFRVTPDNEVSGVDLSEHAETAYEFGGLGVGGQFHPFHGSAQVPVVDSAQQKVNS